MFRSSVITPDCESTESSCRAVLEAPLKPQAALLPIFIPLGPSSWPARLLCCTSVLLIVALYFSRLTLLLNVSLGVIWCLCLLLQWRKIERNAVASLSVSKDGWCLLSDRGFWSETDLWSLEGDYSWHPWLLSVRLRNRSTGQRLQLLLYPDSALAEDLRRLRVLLLTSGS